jgi:hypothetical protein
LKTTGIRDAPVTSSSVKARMPTDFQRATAASTLRSSAGEPLGTRTSGEQGS